MLLSDNKITDNVHPAYRMCSMSVMDNISDPDIIFDEHGICNYYYQFKKQLLPFSEDADQSTKLLNDLIAQIKESGSRQKYDSIIGLSGGVDSTYLAYIASQFGLRPLAVHFDNGWNSELSVMNIQNTIDRLGMDLHTYVIDWEEFRSLQIAYLKASVVDIEAITDHAISSVLYRLAGEMNIKYILSGTNYQTESTMPRSWIFNKTDSKNIRSIHKMYGQRKLSTFPFIDAKVRRYYYEIKGVRSVSLLNYLPYQKAKVKETITQELGWRDYGGKHFESIWTRFYQGHILPVKFHIDKRKPHLSDLIFSNQITREDALHELSKPIYDSDQFHKDYTFVLKKLSLSENEFEEIMRLPQQSHFSFDYEVPVEARYPLLKPVKNIYRWLFPFQSGKANHFHS